MKRYTDQVLSLTTGLPLIGARVWVFLAGTNTLATLYAQNDASGPKMPNPLNANGGFAFYPANGRYDFEIVVPAKPAGSRTSPARPPGRGGSRRT